MLVYIEISKHSNVKYEFNKNKNTLEVDRILHSSVVYPTNYGFIPNTKAEDGDELDILVFTEKINPGTYIDVDIIGYIDMKDEKGLDEKIIAVFKNDPLYKHINDIKDINQHEIKKIIEFFSNYKNLENKKVSIGNIYGKNEALALIKKYTVN